MRKVLALLMACALLAACERPTGEQIATAQKPEPGAGGGEAAPSPGATGDVLAAMRQWAQCMREQGFDVPDPYRDPVEGKLTFGFEGPAKGDPREAQYVIAMETCEEFEIAYQEFNRRPFSDEQMARWRVYTQCMRDQGVEIADPDQAAGIPPFPAPDKVREQRALFEAGMRECQDEFLAARMVPEAS